VQKQSEDSVKIVDRHETILRDHETRLSKVEQLAGDTNDGVKNSCAGSRASEDRNTDAPRERAGRHAR
jgi:hypothetical protein